MQTVGERFGRFLDTVESRWSLYAHAAAILAAFGLPAWATRAANVFSQYAPLSWVVAGFIGVLVWSVGRLIWNWSYRVKINARYDARFIERRGNYNPLDLTFEGQRIYLDDFALPSYPIIEGKTFIDCEIIGPAIIYFKSNNMANPILPPKLDAVWLHPTAQMSNHFTFDNCIFRNCSFQRITMFASIENYLAWRDNPNVNWISLPPSQKEIDARFAILNEAQIKHGLTPYPVPLLKDAATHEEQVAKPL